jgi:hypothetical protein
VKSKKLSAADLRQVSRWIVLNKELLLELHREEIDYETFLGRVKQVDPD